MQIQYSDQLTQYEYSLTVGCETMRHVISNSDTMQLIDPGLPDWKGNVLKHLSAAQLNLARIDMEEKR